MLFHSARDGEQEVRRTYGLFALGLVLLSAILAISNKSIFPYGALGLFGALSFLSFFLRHETDDNWRKPFLLVLGGLGVAMVAFIFFGAFFKREFLVSSGLVMGLLGLGYLCVLMGQLGSGSDGARKVALALGGAGLAMLVYSIYRSTTNNTDTPFFVPVGIILMILGGIYLFTSIGLLSDIPLVVMTRREITSYFYSPIAYFALLGMTLIGMINFIIFLGSLYRGVQEPIVANFVLDIAGILAPIAIVPVITMRLFSEEKRSGTYEVLMSVPISELSVVLSKFIAGLMLFMLLWLPWGIYLIGLQSELDKPFDYRPLMSFMIALLFTGAGFVAMGLFFSSLTKNQIVAAVLTFVGMLAMTCFYIFQQSDLVGPLWKTVFDKLSYLRVWFTALGGQLPIHDLTLHASLAVFWLFLTVKSLEARKWN
jgi:ABC-type transport system involved in multi-copper enzyme maturation permease subunit